MVQPDQFDGLTLPSVALVFQFRTIDQRNCLKRLGVLDSATIELVLAKLDELTGR